MKDGERWLTLAANAGELSAMTGLSAWLYSVNFADQGIPIDPEKCIFWRKKAAALGDASSMWYLGRIHLDGELNGTAINKDATAAVHWLKMAAEAGDGNAMLDMGNLCMKGDAVPQDSELGLKYYLLAAKSNNKYPSGQAEIAFSYFYGQVGLGVNYKLAHEWALKAAQNGDSLGQRILGKCYHDGLDTEKNLDNALRWSLRSAKQGDPIAMADIGRMYLKGHGVPQDYKNAYFWLSLAVSRDIEYAKALRDQASAHLPQDQLLETQRQTREYKFYRELTPKEYQEMKIRNPFSP